MRPSNIGKHGIRFDVIIFFNIFAPSSIWILWACLNLFRCHSTILYVYSIEYMADVTVLGFFLFEMKKKKIKWMFNINNFMLSGVKLDLCSIFVYIYCIMYVLYIHSHFKLVFLFFCVLFHFHKYSIILFYIGNTYFNIFNCLSQNFMWQIYVLLDFCVRSRYMWQTQNCWTVPVLLTIFKFIIF